MTEKSSKVKELYKGDKKKHVCLSSSRVQYSTSALGFRQDMRWPLVWAPALRCWCYPDRCPRPQHHPWRNHCSSGHCGSFLHSPPRCQCSSLSEVISVESKHVINASELRVLFKTTCFQNSLIGIKVNIVLTSQVVMWQMTVVLWWRIGVTVNACFYATRSQSLQLIDITI